MPFQVLPLHFLWLTCRDVMDFLHARSSSICRFLKGKIVACHFFQVIQCSKRRSSGWYTSVEHIHNSSWGCAQLQQNMCTLLVEHVTLIVEHVHTLKNGLPFRQCLLIANICLKKEKMRQPVTLNSSIQLVIIAFWVSKKSSTDLVLLIRNRFWWKLNGDCYLYLLVNL